jgi:hemoglobin
MRKFRLTLSAPMLAGLVLAGLVAGCADKMQTAAKPTLYERLGGQPAVVAVVDDFVGNVAADQRINRFFAHTSADRLKQLLVEQICAGTGGPCSYTGRSMPEAHHGMGVTDADFNALVEDLVKTLNKFNVPQPEQQELLGVLGPMRSQIVGA